MNASGVNADEIRRLDEPGRRPWLRPARAPTSCSTARSCRARPPSWCRRPTTAGSCSPSPGAAGYSSAPRTPRWQLCRSSPGRWNKKSTTCSTTARRYLETAPSRADIKSAFAGLRPMITARRRQGHRDIPAIAGTCRHRLGIGPGDGHRWEVDDLSRDGPGRGRPRGAGGQTSRPSLRDSVIEAARLVSADR